jgi:hypothetical protein
MNTPQTAEQINVGQMGKVEPLPEDVAPIPKFPPRQPKTVTVDASAKAKDPNAWNLSGLRGSPAAVIAAIQAKKDVPQLDRDYLAKKVEVLCAGMNHVTVDCWSHPARGVCIIDITITPSKRLE